MVKDGRCRWAGYFLLSPTLLGLGSGRFLCRCVTSCLGLLVFLARFATSLLASAAVIEIAAVAALAGLLILTTFTALILLVLLNVPHRSGTGWTPWSEPWSEASVVVLPRWFVALVLTSLALVTLTSKVWWVAPSARVRGSALLLLRVSFRGILSTLSAFVTSSAALLTLSITLVVLWIVSSTGRAPPSGVPPIAVSVSSILASLDCNTSWAGDICSLCSLLSLDYIKLHSFSISNTAKIFSRVVLFDGCLVYKNVLFCIIPVDKPISIPDVEPFDCTQDFCCDDLLIPRGSCGCRAGWALRIGSRLRRLLLCLGLAAHCYLLVMASAGGGSLL